MINILKNFLKSNRYTFLVGKGILSLKRNGIKYTYHKALSVLKKDKNSSPVESHYKLFLKSNKEKYNGNLKFSILTPLYNTPINFLEEMIESVLNQTYQNWELCLVDASDEQHKNIGEVISKYLNKDSRIKYNKLDRNLGISENTNKCLKMAIGDYIGLLDHDDLLVPDALYENYKRILEKNCQVLYSDECHISLDGYLVNHFYKPDWNIDLLYCQNYVCHFLVAQKDLLENIKGFDKECDGAQDYDLILRLSELTDKIEHIPKVLYLWRESATSTANNSYAKPYAHFAGIKALNKHIKKFYSNQAIVQEGKFLFTYDVVFENKNNVKVSIIIPFKDKAELTYQCVESIVKNTNYNNFEVLLLNNRSVENETKTILEKISQKYENVKIYDADFDFNWSKLNNFGVSKSTGDVFVFLNNDTKIISKDWLNRLVGDATRDNVGVVGALLKYEDDSIQHAGVVVGMFGVADHIFKGMYPIHQNSPYVSPVLSRNVLAVTGACMAISKKTLNKIGNFDEEFIICGSDVEICLRAYEYGLLNKYNAFVELYHLESKSRDSYIPEIDFICSMRAYDKYLKYGDPYYNINLDLNSYEPREKVNG